MKYLAGIDAKRQVALAWAVVGMLVTVALGSGCGSGAPCRQGPSPFAGTYSGTYTGDDTGTWTAVVDVNGDVSVTVNRGTQTFQGTGRVARSGGAHLITSGTGSGGYFEVIWDGNFVIAGDSITGSGTWANNWGDTGTWQGQRISP